MFKELYTESRFSKEIANEMYSYQLAHIDYTYILIQAYFLFIMLGFAYLAMTSAVEYYFIKKYDYKNLKKETRNKILLVNKINSLVSFISLVLFIMIMFILVIAFFTKTLVDLVDNTNMPLIGLSIGMLFIFSFQAFRVFSFLLGKENFYTSCIDDKKNKSA